MREEIYNFINSFENEDAYWKFQFEMLKKDLPIQKYVSDKEKNLLIQVFQIIRPLEPLITLNMLIK